MGLFDSVKGYHGILLATTFIVMATIGVENRYMKQADHNRDLAGATQALLQHERRQTQQEVWDLQDRLKRHPNDKDAARLRQLEQQLKEIDESIKGLRKVN